MMNHPSRRSSLARPLPADQLRALVERAGAAGRAAFPDGLPCVQPAGVPAAQWAGLGRLRGRSGD